MGKFLDAALNGAATYAGKAYFFKGTKYVRYDWEKDLGDAGYPLGFDKWGFPAPFDKGIDAAVEGREAYKTKGYFFKDDRYIRYDFTANGGKGKVDSGYPRSIVDEWKLPVKLFPGGKAKIDAALNGAGKYARYCYFFSGTSWARYDWLEKEEPVLHVGTLQADWKLPGELAKGVDAALSGWGKKYGNKAYFFLGDKYARYDWGTESCDLKGGDLRAWKTSFDQRQLGEQGGGAAEDPQAKGARGLDRPEKPGLLDHPTAPHKAHPRAPETSIAEGWDHRLAHRKTIKCTFLFASNILKARSQDQIDLATASKSRAQANLLALTAEGILSPHNLALDCFIDTQNPLPFDEEIDPLTVVEQATRLFSLVRARDATLARTRAPTRAVVIMVKIAQRDLNGVTRTFTDGSHYSLINWNELAPDGVTLVHEINHAAGSLDRELTQNPLRWDIMFPAPRTASSYKRDSIWIHDVKRLAAAPFTQ